jgi:gluconolactonase
VVSSQSFTIVGNTFAASFGSFSMRSFLLLAVAVAPWHTAAAAVFAQAARIDLRTGEGVATVKGEWRYHDVKIIEVEGKSKDGSANRTYSYEPRATGPEFDDSQWEIIKPETLKNARGNGQICFCWYRIKIAIPPAAEGKSVFFQTTVDDYGEIWVDGKLPRKPGDTGGPIVAGFNFPNRVELKDARAGKVYQIAIFGINGPISDPPKNWIFLGPTFLELVDKKP